jgi:hypothetical protein
MMERTRGVGEDDMEVDSEEDTLHDMIYQMWGHGSEMRWHRMVWDAGEAETIIAAQEEHGIQPKCTTCTTCAPKQIIEKTLAGCTMGLIPGQRVAKIHTHKITQDHCKPAVSHKVIDTEDPVILVATTTMATPGTRNQFPNQYQ